MSITNSDGQTPQKRKSERLQRYAVFVLFTSTGATALLYQICWAKELRYIFGASTLATSAVIAIFLLGLGTGGLALGRRIDKSVSPLAFYGKLELLIALLAGVSPLLITLTKTLYFKTGGIAQLGELSATSLRLALATMVIGPATFLMGGTLAAVSRALTTPTDSERKTTGLLYGLNAIGSFIGGTVVTFYLIETFGVKFTIWIGACFNAVCALSAIWISKYLSVARSENNFSAKQVDVEGLVKYVAYAALFVSGFTFFGLEIVWYRMLSPLLGGSTYTIGIVLCNVLLGIGIGGSIYSFLWRGKQVHLGLLAMTFALEVITLSIPFLLGDQLAYLALKLQSQASSFGGHVFNWNIICFITILPTSIIAGLQFPLMIALIGKGRRSLGKDVGTGYLLNTLGSFCGSILTGFLLIRILSATGSWTLFGVILAVSSLLILGLALRSSPSANPMINLPMVSVTVISVGFALAMYFLDGPSALWRHGGIGAGVLTKTAFNSEGLLALADLQDKSNAWMRWQKDGTESSVAIFNEDGVNFSVNGKVDGHAVRDAQTQVMSTMLGAFLHPDPKTALVIGLGTGSSAGWLGELPGMERVDVVEIEPAIAEVARQSAAVNKNVLSNPRVRVIYNDAREFLLTTQEKYDLVFSEPSNPYRAGIASLFTQEYYSAIADRLNPDGLFIQWVQGYSVDRTTLSRVNTTLLQTFPRVETWYGKLGDFLMVAGDFEYTAARITEKLAIPVYAEALRIGWKTDSREGFFSHHLGDHDFSLQVAKPTEGHPNTDDKTYIEFAMARTITQDLEAGNTITRDAYNSNAYKPKMTDHATLDENKLRQEFLATLIFEGQEIRNIEALLNPQLHLFSERMELLKSYRDLDFKPVFDRWPVADPATLTYREKIIQLGDLAFAREPQFFAALDQSDPQIKLLSPFFQSIFHGSDQNVEKTGTYLKTAFIHLRTDPWVDPGLIQIALRLAIWVANEDPAPARELYEILSAPFAADVAQKDRIATRWQIAQIIGLQEFCPELLAPWPRYSPWPGFDQLRHACALAEGA